MSNPEIGRAATKPVRRGIYDHQINKTNGQIVISADCDGMGGACHHYEIVLTSSPDSSDFPLRGDHGRLAIHFQDGPLREAGLNGITDEALIAVIIDRLRGFQRGPYSCRENAIALTHFEEGLMWLHKRTQNRERRGVEGTSVI